MKIIIHKKQINSNTRYERSFFLVSFLLNFIGVIQSSMVAEIVPIFGLYVYVFCFIFLLMFFSKKEFSSKKTVWYLAIGLFVGVFSTIFSHMYTVLLITSFVLASKYVDFKTVLKSSWISTILGMGVVFVFDYLGMLSPIKFYRGNAIRYMYGFTHPNTFAMYLMAFNFTYFLYRGKETKLYEYLIQLFSIYVMVFLNHSNTAAVCMAIFLFITLNYRYIPLWEKFLSSTRFYIKYGIIFITPIVIIGILVFVDSPSNFGFFSELRNTAGLRIYYGNLAIREYGLSILGNQMKTFGSFETASVLSRNTYFVVDCLYVLLAVREGILASIFIWGMMIGTAKTAINNRRWDIFGTVLIMLIFSLMESGLINSAFFFLFSYYIYGVEFAYHIEKNRLISRKG